MNFKCENLFSDFVFISKSKIWNPNPQQDKKQLNLKIKNKKKHAQDDFQPPTDSVFNLPVIILEEDRSKLLFLEDEDDSFGLLKKQAEEFFKEKKATKFPNRTSSANKRISKLNKTIRKFKKTLKELEQSKHQLAEDPSEWNIRDFRASLWHARWVFDNEICGVWRCLRGEREGDF